MGTNSTFVDAAHASQTALPRSKALERPATADQNVARPEMRRPLGDVTPGDGVWQRLHELLLSKLRAAARIDWSRVVLDSGSVHAMVPPIGRPTIPPSCLTGRVETRYLVHEP